MAITPIQRLRVRLSDADRLIEIHEECTGNAAGRRHGYDVLNRSVIVLSVAAWEGFVEDLLENAAGRIALRLRSSSGLPENVRDSMLAQMHEQNSWSKLDRTTKETIWSLTGRGWRRKYTSYTRGRIERLNTPNYENVQKLYSSVIGMTDFGVEWGARRWTQQDYIDRLNKLLTLRHRIAHGTIGSETVGKTRAKRAIAMVERIGGWTDKGVQAHLQTLPLRRRRSRTRP